MSFFGRNQGLIAPVNWNDPITRDLVFLVDAARSVAEVLPRNIAGKLSGGASVQGTGSITTASTLIGPVWSFPSGGRYFRFGGHAEFESKTAFTLMWYGIIAGTGGTIDGNATLFGNASEASDYAWMMGITTDAFSAGTQKIVFWPKSGSSVTSSQTYAYNTPTVIVCTYDGATARLYINGALDNSTGSLSGSSTSTGSIELHHGYYVGRSCQVRAAALWDRVLGAEDIAHLGLQPLNRLLLQPDGLIAFAPFGGGGAATAAGTAAGSSAATAVGRSTAASDGDAAGSSTAAAISTFGNYGAAAGSSTATAVGRSTAQAIGEAAGSSRARGFSPGGLGNRVIRRAGGGIGLFAGRHRVIYGGQGAANPSPPAGDALTQLLATMAVGELKLLSNTSYNLKTGPGGLLSAGEASAVDGDLYYNRARWDAGHPSAYTFANDLAVMNYIDGTFDVGTGDLSSIMLYSGVAYDATRKLICMIAPGGHSNGGHTGGLSFDAEAACQAILDGLPNGTGAGKREKWQALCDPMPYSAPDTTVGEFKHANWGGMADYLDGSTAGFRWPQPVVNPVLGPANDVGPYSMHTYSAIHWHPGTDEIWISGYTPGVLDHDFSSVPGATWIYDAATKAYTKITTFTGSDAPSFLAPPDGDSSVMFAAYHSGGSNWASVLTTSPYTLTLRSHQGTGDAFESDAAPFWVKDFATSGKWSILRMSTTSGKFNAHPDVWPLGTTTGASLVPATGYSGDTRLFNGSSGYFYDDVDKLIYVICDNGAGGGYAVKCQTIDMWQGNSTVQATWAVAEVTMSGDTFGAAGVNFETRSGFDNKVINLGSAYGAALVVTYPGQVRMFKYREGA